MAKLKDTPIIDEAQAELAEERNKRAKAVVKNRLREIAETEKALAEMQDEFDELLEMEVDEIDDLD